MDPRVLIVMAVANVSELVAQHVVAALDDHDKENGVMRFVKIEEEDDDFAW
jgi:hypothetical protein